MDAHPDRHAVQSAGSIECEGCGECVDLSQPLARPGWQVLHACATHQIEAHAAQDRSPAWAWRMVRRMDSGTVGARP